MPRVALDCSKGQEGGQDGIFAPPHWFWISLSIFWVHLLEAELSLRHKSVSANVYSDSLTGGSRHGTGTTHCTLYTGTAHRHCMHCIVQSLHCQSDWTVRCKSVTVRVTFIMFPWIRCSVFQNNFCSSSVKPALSVINRAGRNTNQEPLMQVST